VLIPDDAPLREELAIACSACGARAATLRLFDSFFAIADFVSSEMQIDRERMAPLAAAMAARDAAAVHDVWWEYAPCFCRGCATSYCAKCWRGVPVFDDGFYDCTRGTCPRGHDQTIDD
jgi:hypothetical protein